MFAYAVLWAGYSDCYCSRQGSKAGVFIIPCSASAESGSIGKGLVHQSVWMSNLANSSLMVGIDFLHIVYHDQVPWAIDTHKIEFGSVPNFSNYSNFFINFECLL